MRMAWNVLGDLALFILGAVLGSASMVIYRHSDELVQVYRHGFDELVRLVSPAENRNVLYYRDPSGAPYWSAAPKKDAGGRDYLPVYEDEEPAFGPGGELIKPARANNAARRILYYRNPMGLPDTSPVPKKDPMGMDY